MESSSFKLKWKKIFWSSIGSIIFCICGILIIVREPQNDSIIPWLATILFGTLPILGIKQLLRGNPILTIDENGIESRSIGVGVIAWDDIISARPILIQKNVLVALKLKNLDKYTEQQSIIQQIINYTGPIFGMERINIPLSNADGDPAKILALIYEGIKYSHKSQMNKNNSKI